jgi:hypothetical protein
MADEAWFVEKQMFEMRALDKLPRTRTSTTTRRTKMRLRQSRPRTRARRRPREIDVIEEILRNIFRTITGTTMMMIKNPRTRTSTTTRTMKKNLEHDDEDEKMYDNENGSEERYKN